MMRGIRLGTWVASIAVVGACGGGQEEARSPASDVAAGSAAAQSSAAQQRAEARQRERAEAQQRALAQEQAEAQQRALAQQQAEAEQRAQQQEGMMGPAQAGTEGEPMGATSSLLEMIPAGIPRLAVVRVTEALRQPLFDELVDELGEMPRVAAQTERIEEQCGENPLSVVQELVVFDGQGATQPSQGPGQQQGGAPPAGQPGAAQPGAAQPGAAQGQQGGVQAQAGVRAPEMLVQLEKPASWALQCLTTMRPEFSALQVGGRDARRMGPFVVVDAGNDRLLVARQETAAAALQRLSAAEAETAPNQAAERVEDLGEPLVFGTGAFPNRMGVDSAETVVSAQGEALELNLSGDMRDAEAAASAVKQLQLGLSIADAFVGRQVRDGQVQQGTQQRLRAVLDNIRIQQADDKVRVAVRLPDAETQRFVGGLLARFLAARGGQGQPVQQGAPPAGG